MLWLLAAFIVFFLAFVFDSPTLAGFGMGIMFCILLVMAGVLVV
jgi:hypothetical protein